jgi:hypothetical protein
MQLIRWPFPWPCGSDGTVPSASPSTAGLGLPEMPLDATIGRVFAPYRPSGRHGHRFRRKKSSFVFEKSLFEASIQKARNGPSTHVIEATSCVERSNATIKAEEHNFLSNYQMLTTDKNR